MRIKRSLSGEKHSVSPWQSSAPRPSGEGDIESIRSQFEAIADRHQDLLSVGVRRGERTTRAEFGRPCDALGPVPPERSRRPAGVRVPISQGDEKWGAPGSILPAPRLHRRLALHRRSEPGAHCVRRNGVPGRSWRLLMERLSKPRLGRAGRYSPTSARRPRHPRRGGHHRRQEPVHRPKQQVFCQNRGQVGPRAGGGAPVSTLEVGGTIVPLVA